jgi:hypothetical protein
MPRYSAPFLRSPAFGYLLSAMTGAGLLILAGVLFSWLQRRARDGAGGVP